MTGFPDLATWWLQLHFAIQFCALVLIACVVYVVLVWWHDSRRWRRLVRVCGSEASALRVLTAAEAIPVDVRSERLMAMGMEGANRRGWIR
jgi:hypothetical protein